jgi:hypothetical protein
MHVKQLQSVRQQYADRSHGSTAGPQFQAPWWSGQRALWAVLFAVAVLVYLVLMVWR